MAKRFTETNKWDKPWYRKLGSKLRDIRQYVLDHCDCAGVWEIDLEKLEWVLKETVSLEEIKLCFNNEVLFLKDNKLFVLGFIDFQYGELSENCKPHIPVIKRLKNLNLLKGYLKGISKGINTLEDKEKEQYKEKEKDKEKEKEEGSVRGETKFDFEKPYLDYPKKIGKAAGMNSIKRQIKHEQDYLEFCKAVKNYAEYVKDTNYEYIKQFSSFVGARDIFPWKEFINPIEKPVKKYNEISSIEAIKKSLEGYNPDDFR